MQDNGGTAGWGRQVLDQGHSGDLEEPLSLHNLAGRLLVSTYVWAESRIMGASEAQFGAAEGERESSVFLAGRMHQVAPVAPDAEDAVRFCYRCV